MADTGQVRNHVYIVGNNQCWNLEVHMDIIVCAHAVHSLYTQ